MDRKKLLKKLVIPIIAFSVLVFFFVVVDVLMGTLYKAGYYKTLHMADRPDRSLLDQMESKSLDFLLSFRAKLSKRSLSGGSQTTRELSPLVSEDIMIVAIDDPSLFKIGRWPFRRTVHAELADYFTNSAYRENTLFYDIFFVEPDSENPEYDAELISSLNSNGRVVLDYPAREYTYTSVEEANDLKGRFADSIKEFGVLTNVSGDFRKERLQEFTALTMPLIPYQQGVDALGYANTIQDTDSIVRRYPLVSRYREWSYKKYASIVPGLKHDTISFQGAAIEKSGNQYRLKPNAVIVFDQSLIPLAQRKEINAGDIELFKSKADIYTEGFMLDVMKTRGQISTANKDIIARIRAHLQKSGLQDGDKAQFTAAVNSVDVDNLVDMYDFITNIISAITPFAAQNEVWADELEFFQDLIKDAVIVDKSTLTMGSNENANIINLYDIIYGNATPVFDIFLAENHYFIKSVPLTLIARYFHVEDQNIEVVLGRSITLHSPMVADSVSGELIKPVIRGRTMDQITIPLDKYSKMLINYAGPRSTPNREQRTTYDVHSYSDFISTNRQLLVKNKLVLVGAFSRGMADDMYQSPLSSMFGIEVIANTINTAIMNDFITSLPKIVYYLILFIMGLLVVFLGNSKNIVRGYLYSFVLILIYVVVAVLLFINFSIALQIPSIIIISVLSLGAVFVFRILTEEKQKKQIKGIFSKYVNSSVVDQLIMNPPKLGGEDRDLTVQFSDIRGFTTLSEALSAQELVRVLNNYLTAMTDIIMENDGTLDKYIGDAIMCFWGAPITNPSNAEVACRAAILQLDKLKEINSVMPKEHQLNIGIGLNSGNMTVGNMGSEGRMNYTVMGDNVNLASRLEGINKYYGTNIIISEFTYEKVKDNFFCREVDEIKVKGKHKPVKIYELLGEIKELKEHGIL